MRYEILHHSEYTYQNPVSIGHHLARLAPLQLPNQQCEWHGLDIVPEPANMMGHTDYFGNKTLFFAFHGSHKSLKVTAHSFVEVHAPVVPLAGSTMSWESIRDAAHADALNPDTEAGEFMYSSNLVKTDKMFTDFAAVCFPPGRPILEAALDLNQRIYREFKFDPTATDVATPVEEAFKKRAGVCQDFAHILIACLRSLGLPARYVSGYLETMPPPGKLKLIGADASHAWISLWCGAQHQWIDLDPTNNCIPAERHITVAYGRDFSDVSPLRGVVYGSGQQKMKVSVDVIPKR